MDDIELIYRKYYPYVKNYARSLCFDENLAEDIAQETFYKAINSYDKFNHQCKIETWLCRIAHNIFVNTKRRKPTENIDSFLNLTTDCNVEESIIKTDNIKSFYEENGIFGISNGGYRFPYFNPIIKKGVEYMGIDPDTMGHDNKLYSTLLHARETESWTDHRVPLNPKEFAMWYTYFALFTNIMPYGSPGINYYIHAENDSLRGWGWSGFHEDIGNRYIISLQPKDDIYCSYSFIFAGFQREDMVEIAESIVLK